MAKKTYKLSSDQLKLTPLELAKDIEMRRALSILQELDPEIDIQWVKKGTKVPASVAANRKLLRPEG